MSFVCSADLQHPPTFPRSRVSDAPIPASIRLRKRNTSTSELMSSTTVSQQNHNRAWIQKQKTSSTAQTKMNKSETRHNPQLSRQVSSLSQRKSSSVSSNGAKSEQKHDRRVTYESEESDNDMGDFIVDDVDNSMEMQSIIRQIFGNREYDESREISFLQASCHRYRESSARVPAVRSTPLPSQTST